MSLGADRPLTILPARTIIRTIKHLLSGITLQKIKYQLCLGNHREEMLTILSSDQFYLGLGN